MTSSRTETRSLIHPPGLNKNTTVYAAEGEYVDGDRIRFHYGKVETIGGWQQELSSGTFLGTPRNLMAWTDLDSQKYIFAGTDSKQYIRTQGVFTDITPIVNTESPIDITTINTEVSVNVGYTAHTRNVGDYVILSSGSSVGGLDMNGEFEVITVVDANNFTITSTTPATSSATGGAYTVESLLSTGLSNNTGVSGWGTGTWGEGTWGTARTTTTTTELHRQYSMVPYGEDLIYNPRGGAMYYWDTSVGVAQRAQEITGSEVPNQINFTLLGPARQLVLLGTLDDTDTFDPLLVRFSDTESTTIFDSTDTNQAGFYRLEHGNEIICGIQSRREIVILTNSSVHAMRRVGGQIVFAFDVISKNTTGPCGQAAAIEQDDVVYWWSPTGFKVYDGQVRDLPCSLFKYLFDPSSEGRLNQEQKEKVQAFTGKDFNEIGWVYPSGTSTECDRYVLYNTQMNCWYDGNIERTCWIDTGVYSKPYAFSPDGTLYIHEQGDNDDGSPLNAFVETSFFDVGEGDSIIFMDRFIPDAEISKTLNITICGRKYPNDTTTLVEKGPFSVRQETRKFHPRVRAREVSIKYHMNEFNGSFRLGKNRIGILQDGER